MTSDCYLRAVHKKDYDGHTVLKQWVQRNRQLQIKRGATGQSCLRTRASCSQKAPHSLETDSWLPGPLWRDTCELERKGCFDVLKK